MKKIIIYICLFVQLFLFSCMNMSAPQNVKRKCDNNGGKDISNTDSVSKIMLPTNDSIACYLDSVIGRFHIKHYTTNDSTGKCIVRFTVGAENRLDSIIHYDRKLHIYIRDGNYVFKKIITRKELCKIAKQEEYESLCIRYVDVKLINDSSLLYHIGLEEKDNWSISFDYVYSNKKFIFKKSEYNGC